MEIKGPTSIQAPTPGIVATVVATPSGMSTAQSPSPAVDLVQLSGLLALLQPGQQLEVMVAALEDNHLLLQLPAPLVDAQGNRTWIQLRTPATIPAQVGQTLQLEVVDANPAAPLLKLTRSTTPAMNLQTALQLALNKQQPAAPFYATVAVLNQPATAAVLQALPSEVRALLQLVWRQLPEESQLQSALAIKQALQHSGVFLEGNIAHQSENTSGAVGLDLRASLLRLASALRENLTATNHGPSPAAASTLTPSVEISPRSAATAALAHAREVAPAPHPNLPEAQARAVASATLLNSTEHGLTQFLQQTEAVLARMQTHQLQMATTDTAHSGWLLELPVRHGQGVDLFDLRIHPDGHEQKSTKPSHGWTVMLAFDLAGLGPMRVQISLQQHTISTYWWASHERTVALFNDYVDTFKSRLQANGLRVQHLHCQTGVPKAGPSQKPSHYSNTSVDERV
ncbi:MAG: flagellar hook-length control protein FliK [Gammaproteobacteria bacterium]|nr:flagellar hook-length control protein FliK [Gammaproteobacteria bacterium]